MGGEYVRNIEDILAELVIDPSNGFPSKSLQRKVKIERLSRRAASTSTHYVSNSVKSIKDEELFLAGL